MALHLLGTLSDLADGSGREVVVGSRRLAVFRWGGRVYVLKNFCPHEGELLHLGRLCDGSIVCRAHGWRFDLATGRCLHGEPASRVASYPVSIQGDQVFVDLG